MRKLCMNKLVESHNQSQLGNQRSLRRRSCMYMNRIQMKMTRKSRYKEEVQLCLNLPTIQGSLLIKVQPTLMNNLVKTSKGLELEF